MDFSKHLAKKFYKLGFLNDYNHLFCFYFLIIFHIFMDVVI